MYDDGANPGGEIASTSRHRLPRRAIRLVALACVTTVSLATIAHFMSIRRSSRLEISTLQVTRDKLATAADRADDEREQADRDKQVVLNLLGQCRAADDIPDLRGNRIVARYHDAQELCLYVPDGSHVLEISAAWKPSPAAAAAPEASIDNAQPAGAKTWTIPLRPSSGYWLELVTDRQGGPVRWELTSNHPDFEARTEAVPLDNFSRRGASWTFSDILRFPNQVDSFSTSDLEAAANSPPSPKLMNTRLSGARGEHPYSLDFAVRILSDGPACVSASDAMRIAILGREDLLLPYRGEGKYELTAPAQPAPK